MSELDAMALLCPSFPVTPYSPPIYRFKINFQIIWQNNYAHIRLSLEAPPACLLHTSGCWRANFLYLYLLFCTYYKYSEFFLFGRGSAVPRSLSGSSDLLLDSGALSLG